jgi:hypothetical protein
LAILISVSCIAGIGALVVPAHTVFGENWSVAGGRLTHLPVCLPNANLANKTVVLDSITIGQLINYFERDFPTVSIYETEIKSFLLLEMVEIVKIVLIWALLKVEIVKIML